ncbi:MAG: DUF559 domain-containing protein [Solirubrobacteraceae bacterium]
MVTGNAKVQVATLAGRQFGRISRAQLLGLGADSRTIHRWLEGGYLHRVLPRVYAVGHRARTTESDLAAALLYAGPGAMLSHATAAWWLGLADSRPHMIHLSTPRRCKSIPGIKVHQRRTLKRAWHERLPVTSIKQTLEDYASSTSLSRLRRALARAEYQGFDVQELEPRRSLPGSLRLRTALKSHRPSLALTKSDLELLFQDLCEQYDLPLPEINARVAGWEVDALWRQQRLVVEIDGTGNHRTPGQIRRDRRKDLDLRAADHTVLRYSDEQVKHRASVIAAEIQQSLTNPEPSA